jgi:hypothetical protein
MMSTWSFGSHSAKERVPQQACKDRAGGPAAARGTTDLWRPCRRSHIWHHLRAAATGGDNGPTETVRALAPVRFQRGLAGQRGGAVAGAGRAWTRKIGSQCKDPFYVAAGVVVQGPRFTSQRGSQCKDPRSPTPIPASVVVPSREMGIAGPGRANVVTRKPDRIRSIRFTPLRPRPRHRLSLAQEALQQSPTVWRDSVVVPPLRKCLFRRVPSL